MPEWNNATVLRESSLGSVLFADLVAQLGGILKVDSFATFVNALLPGDPWKLVAFYGEYLGAE